MGIMKRKAGLRQKPLLIVLILMAAICLGWIVWGYVKPSIYLIQWEFYDSYYATPESDQAAVKHLASAGPRVIEPVISHIRDRGPWSKGTALLPLVLGELGRPAHQQLIDAIAKETHPSSRAHLIYTLQMGFDDYRFLPAYLDMVQTSPGLMGESHLKMQLLGYLARHEERLPRPDPEGATLAIPDIVVNRHTKQVRINPAFVEWYQLVSRPKGLLPTWRPKP